jgi:hypothetical protein
MKTSNEWCQMVFDGTDTDGSKWYRCTVHDRLVFGDAYVCEGYEPPKYNEGPNDGIITPGKARSCLVVILLGLAIWALIIWAIFKIF